MLFSSCDSAITLSAMRKTLLALFSFWAIAAFAAAQQAPTYDVLILHGRVMDGSGNPWVSADVGIVGDRIIFVGKASPKATAKKTIDATGLIVAPGFIDMLGQSELSLLIDPRGESKITQGVTTEITGEGETVGPLNQTLIADQKDFTDHFHLNIDWISVD